MFAKQLKERSVKFLFIIKEMKRMVALKKTLNLENIGASQKDFKSGAIAIVIVYSIAIRGIFYIKF